ncbi:MAG: septum formation initiator family protein [Oscillospiraceae bacterium]|nr:septum formation initiator family protein [Oscillospiraceae bacterium]
MRRKRAGIFTKLAVLLLVGYAAFSLMDLHGQIESARGTLVALEEAVNEQALENAVLTHELENRYNPEIIERIARDRHGLLMPGERTFYGVTN